MREQKRFPGASGEFSFLLSGITLATKMIQAQVRRAGLTDVLGEHGDINVQGEIQQKLDGQRAAPLHAAKPTPPSRCHRAGKVWKQQFRQPLIGICKRQIVSNRHINIRSRITRHIFQIEEIGLVGKGTGNPLP